MNPTSLVCLRKGKNSIEQAWVTLTLRSAENGFRATAASINIVFFFFKATATTEVYSLSLHDALPILVSWIKHSVDRFVIVSIFIPKLRLILILNSFLGSSDSLVFSELFHSLAPRPLAARSISDFLLTYLAT